MYKGLCRYSTTHVFWDVDDWPSPNFENPCLIFGNIESNLRKEGYIGGLSARAYGDALKSKELGGKYSRAGFYSYEPGDDKLERVERMVKDIILCPCDIGEVKLANFLVLANISEELMAYILVSMKWRGHNVVFARKNQRQEDDDDDSSSSSSLIGRLSESGITEWIWPNLLDVDESSAEFRKEWAWGLH